MPSSTAGRMPELLVRVLRRLLPWTIAHDVFEPAWLDQRIQYLMQREHVRSRARRTALSLAYALRAFVLFLDCWRIALTDLPNLSRPNPHSIDPTSKEPVAMFFHNLKGAFVRLTREPGFTLAAVTTLALGVAANVAVFAVVEVVLLRPLPYNNPEQLVVLNHRDERTGITKEFIALGDYIDITQRQTAFAQVSAYSTGDLTVYGEGEPYRVNVLQSEPALLQMFDVQPVLGRNLNADDGRDEAAPVVMLSHNLWRTHFKGDPATVGRSVKIGQRAYTVVGILPPSFRFPATAETDALFPMGLPATSPAARKSGWTFAVARMKPNQTIQSAGANLTSIAQQMEREHPDQNTGTTYYIASLRDQWVGNTKTALKLLLGAVLTVLLIACANVANLQLARSMGRRREIAVRMALGAGRGQLASLLLSESLALALVATVSGILLAHWGVRALIALVPESVNVPGLAEVQLSPVVLAFAVAITVATTLAFGLVSALTMRAEKATDVLVSAGRSTMTMKVRRATSGLVAVEIALAIVLLIGAGLILRSFAGLLAVNPGFSVGNVDVVGIQIPGDRYESPEARAAFYSSAYDALRATGLVSDVGVGVVVPLTGNNWTVPFERTDKPVGAGQRPPDVGWQNASGGYFKALQIPLVAGRLFDERDRPDGPPVVIISESLARTYYPGEGAVGRQVKLGDRKAEIIGVVGDIRRAGLNDAPRADMYFAAEQASGTQTTLFVRTKGDPASAIPTIQSTLRRIEPNIAFMDSKPLASVAAQSVGVVQFLLWILGVFAALALGLAAIGIYGVMAHVVRQRTREIGTRMAVGATRGNILWLVLREGAVVSTAGIVVGLAIGFAATRYLRSVLFGITASDPLTLGVAIVVIAATTMTACYLPARRAMTVDPARTLAQQ